MALCEAAADIWAGHQIFFSLGHLKFQVFETLKPFRNPSLPSKNTHYTHTNENVSFPFSFMGKRCEYKQDIQIKMDHFILIDL